MKSGNRRIGDEQLVGGLPKHMHATAVGVANMAGTNDEIRTYWRFRPKPTACDMCNAMEGLWFEQKPEPVHPNCRCEIEEFQTVRVTGRADAIIVPPGVDIETNLTEARRIRRICEVYVLKVPTLGGPASFF